MTEEQNNATTLTNPKLLRFIQVILIAITAFLLVSHILKWGAIQVDSITLALVGLLLVIPFVDLIRKIKVGDFEAEIGKAEVSKAQAKAAIDLPPTTEEELDSSEKQIRELLRSDPRLAMAKIRIDLEGALYQLYSATIGANLESPKISLSRLVETLVQRKVLTGSIASSIQDVMTLANRAVHGERIEANAAEELAILGVRLVHEIQQAYLEHLLQPVENEVITPQEADLYRAARYRVTTIIPLIERPKRNIYIFDQEALELFLENYEEYAEFIVSVVQI